MKILALSPHPDDVEIGMGAVLSKLHSAGHEITIGVCTGEGDLKMVHSNKTVKYTERQEEQMNAAAALGHKIKVEFLNLASASNFDNFNLSKFVTAFDELFPKFDRVYIPMPTYNEDHNVVWKASLAALRMGKADKLEVFAYEQAFSLAIGPQVDTTFGKVYEEVSYDQLDKASGALTCHKSQMEGRGDSIYGPAGVWALAELRGLEVGADYAQRLYVVRQVVLL